jgi:hypothetical protein
MKETKEEDLSRHDLRWLWLAITLAGAAVATVWLARGGELYAHDGERDSLGIADASATTARFAILLALGAAAVDFVGMLSAAKTHTVPGVVSLVCGVSAVASIVATTVHARAASIDFGYEADPWLVPAIGAMAALAVGGIGLWFDARAEHRRAVLALATIEREIHRVDGDLGM